MRTNISRKRFFRWVIIIAAAWLILWGLPQLARFYTDWLWFGEVGYLVVFWRTFWAKLLTGLVFGLGFFAIVFGNSYLAKRLAPRAVWYEDESRFRQEVAYLMERFLERWLGWLALGVSLLLAYAVGKQASNNWLSILMALNPTSFGQTDPLFQRDLSFYIFRLPLLEMLHNYLAGAIVVAIIFSAAIHYFDKAIRTVKGVPAFSPHVKIHLSILLAAWLAIKTWDYWLQTQNLLYSDRGVVFGASYTDINARLFALHILMAVALLGALVILLNMRFRGFVLPLGVFAVLFIASILGAIYPEAIQRLRVTPNEQTLEAPYIERNIQATRFGFNLEKVQDSVFPVLTTFTSAMLESGRQTTKNVRLWDHRPLLETLQQQQQLQPYYRFQDVDIDRYPINGESTQVMLSARELDVDSLPSKEWQNEHLFYTHGFGVVLAPVNEVTSGGDPELLVKDIPPSSKGGLPTITKPGIYYGEIAKLSQFSLVDTDKQENDYPLGGKTTAKTTYSGTGGAPIGSWLTRLAMSMRFGDINLLLSNNITAKTKIIFQRSVADRVWAIAPFLAYEYDPYIVIGDDGRLYWIQDAYTLSGRLPYSQPYAPFPDRVQGDVNYIRNSVKIVIDAYDGTTKFYIADAKDPLVATFGKIFPGAFAPLAEMPREIARHIRYPEELFNLQARVYTTYHMTDPQIFYSKQDKWDIAKEKGGKQTTLRDQYSQSDASGEETMQAYYTLMQLPGEKTPEFILMIPFTPLNRDNMVAWMAARCDREHYGEMVSYEFPREALVYGPKQVEGYIDQQSEISKLFSWWDQRGSNVVRGNLLVIPIGKAVLYIEPIFLKAQTGAIPQLRMVTVGNQIGGTMQISFGPTLERALATAVGAAPPLTAEALLEQTNAATAVQATKPASTTQAGIAAPTAENPQRQLARQSLDQMRRANERLRAGDLAGYQRELGKLEKMLEEQAK